MNIPKLPMAIVCAATAASCAQAEGVDAFHWSGKLKRGVNISCALEAPQEGKWGVVIQEEHFDVIRAAGFDSVRLPVRWNAHAGEEAPYAVDPAFLDRVGRHEHQILGARHPPMKPRTWPREGAITGTRMKVVMTSDMTRAIWRPS